MKKGRRKSHQWKGKFVCVFLCVCLCVFVSACGCVFECVLCCVFVCVHVHTCVHACVPVSVVSVGFCMYVCVCNFVYVFLCVHKFLSDISPHNFQTLQTSPKKLVVYRYICKPSSKLCEALEIMFLK